MIEMRRSGLVLQEADLSCGAAALATILNYQHGESVTEREILLELIRRDIYIETPELIQVREGFSLLDLKRVADQRGYEGIGYGNLTLADALDLAPVITPIDPRGFNHFVVLLGAMGDRIAYADPAFGNASMSRERFERVWMEVPDLGHVGFVVTSGGTPAPPGRLRPDPRVFLMPPLTAVRQTIFR